MFTEAEIKELTKCNYKGIESIEGYCTEVKTQIAKLAFGNSLYFWLPEAGMQGVNTLIQKAHSCGLLERGYSNKISGRTKWSLNLKKMYLQQVKEEHRQEVGCGC